MNRLTQSGSSSLVTSLVLLHDDVVPKRRDHYRDMKVNEVMTRRLSSSSSPLPLPLSLPLPLPLTPLPDPFEMNLIDVRLMPDIDNDKSRFHNTKKRKIVVTDHHVINQCKKKRQERQLEKEQQGQQFHQYDQQRQHEEPSLPHHHQPLQQSHPQHQQLHQQQQPSSTGLRCRSKKSVRFNLSANTIHSILRPRYLDTKVNIACVFDDDDEDSSYQDDNNTMKQILWYSPVDLLMIRLRECILCQKEQEKQQQHKQKAISDVDDHHDIDLFHKIDDELSALYRRITRSKPPVGHDNHHHYPMDCDIQNNNIPIDHDIIKRLLQSYPLSFSSHIGNDYRGLERWSCPQLVRLRSFYTWLCHTLVLLEQSSFDQHRSIDNHHNNDHMDMLMLQQERIANIYQTFSRPAQTLALIIGHIDSVV